MNDHSAALWPEPGWLCRDCHCAIAIWQLRRGLEASGRWVRPGIRALPALGHTKGPVGGVAERSMAADCKSADLIVYEGSNPSPSTTRDRRWRASWVR